MADSGAVLGRVAPAGSDEDLLIASDFSDASDASDASRASDASDPSDPSDASRASDASGVVSVGEPGESDEGYEDDEDDDPEEIQRLIEADQDNPDDPNTLPGTVSALTMLAPLRSMGSPDFLRLALLAAPMLPGVYLWKAEGRASPQGFYKLVRQAYVMKLAYESYATVDIKVRLGWRTSLSEVVVALMYRCLVGHTKVVNLVCSLSAADDASTFALFERSKLLRPQVCANAMAAASRTLADRNNMGLLIDRNIYLDCARHFPLLLKDQQLFRNPERAFRDYWTDFSVEVADVGDVACLGRPDRPGDPDPNAEPAQFTRQEQNDLARAMVMMLLGTFAVSQKNVRPKAQLIAMHSLAK